MAWRKGLSTLYTWTVVLFGILAVVVFHSNFGASWRELLFYPGQNVLKIIALVIIALLCILAEWMIIRLPQGDNLTTSFVLVMLTLLIAGPVEAVEVIVMGSFIGYGLLRRQSLGRILFYSGHYALSSTAAGWFYFLAEEKLPRLLLQEAMHLPAVGVYFLIYASCSQLLINVRDGLILPTEVDISVGETKLPKTTLLIAFLLMPLPLLTYYLYYSRRPEAVIFILVPLFAVLVAFRSYINIDTYANEITTLYEILQEFVAALGQEETVQTVAKGIAISMKKLVAYDACLVYSLEESSNTFVLVHNEGRQEGPEFVEPSRGLLGEVAVSGEGTVAQEITPKQEDQLGWIWLPKTSLLAMPLRAETGAVVGLVLLVKFDKAFSLDSFRLSKILSNQAGPALRNAQIYEQTQQLADTDRMLGLMNQPAFRLRAQGEISRARQDGRSVAIILTDVDDFKKVNTAYGHQGGDALLKGLADILTQAVGGEGIVGRYGGEEFVVMLPGANELRAERKAEEIRQTVEDHDFIIDDSVRAKATISLGVAVFPQDGQEVPDLIEKADRATYLAKRMGKNRVCLYGERRIEENL